jgi:hypothetical protein
MVSGGHLHGMRRAIAAYPCARLVPGRLSLPTTNEMIEKRKTGRGWVLGILTMESAGDGTGRLKIRCSRPSPVEQ